jgi:hypothetical protein
MGTILMVGYDLDGVLCPMLQRLKPFFKSTGEERKLFDSLKKFWVENAPILQRPTGDYYIISGRGNKLKTETETWIKKNRLTPKGLF